MRAKSGRIGIDNIKIDNITNLLKCEGENSEHVKKRTMKLKNLNFIIKNVNF